MILTILLLLFTQAHSLCLSHFRLTPSAIVKSPKTKPKTSSPITKPDPNIIWKETVDVVKQFEEDGDIELYTVLLYNDPFNKRQYVEEVLIQVFNWDVETAHKVMMTAHTEGYAITGEYSKEIAEEYCKKLLEKRLIAEVFISDMNAANK